MLDFIVKYWLEFLFGVIAVGMTGFAKHYYSLVKKQRLAEQKETKSEQTHEMLEAIDKLRSELKADIAKR